MFEVDNTIAYDLEVYPNFFLAGFELPDGTIYQYRITDTDFSHVNELVRFINWVEQSPYTLMGFNSQGYDDPVLSEFLANPHPTTAYRTSLQIIEEGAKPWDFLRDVYSIDLMPVLPGRISLKKIGVCLGHKRLQELPINPHQNLTPEEMNLLADYNINDLQITRKLYKAIYKELKLRSDLSIEHGINLLSKGEAKVAELILTESITKYTGVKGKELKEIARTNVLRNPTFNIRQPSWWKKLPVNKYPSLHAVINKGNDIFQKPVHVVNFKLEPGALSNTLYLGDRWYQMGIGGLHSMDDNGAWIPGVNETLMDVDVTSYYPLIMVNENLSPRHWVFGGVDHFKGAFVPIIERRIEAKRQGDKTVADRVKIIINGTFGKTNDPYSSLYDPFIMSCVTVTGQLGLLALVAMVTDVGGTVVSANTDGITILYDKEHDSRIREVVSEWETLTQHTMEYCEYAAFYQKDVNNYIAIPVADKPKLKGVFAIPELGGVDLRHTPNAQIVSRAVIECLSKAKDLALTITECTDIQEFLLTQKVDNTYNVTWRDKDIGKMVRFYKAVDGSPIIRTPVNDSVKGNQGVLANSDSSVPLIDLPESFNSITDIDYDWYIAKAHELLNLITQPKKRYMNTVAKDLIDQGFMPTLISKGKPDRKTPSEGVVDFSSMNEDTQELAVCTGRHFGVLARRFSSGRTQFYKVDRKYPAKTRATILKDYGFELLFGSNLPVEPYTQLHTIPDEDILNKYYTETELGKVR